MTNWIDKLHNRWCVQWVVCTMGGVYIGVYDKGCACT